MSRRHLLQSFGLHYLCLSSDSHPHHGAALETQGENGRHLHYFFYLLNTITPLCSLNEVGQKVKKKAEKKVRPFFSTLNPISLNLVLDLQTFPGHFYGKRQQICFSSVKIFHFSVQGPALADRA